MAIMGIDGPPGTGKTALAVTMAMREIEREGERVFANIPLFDLRPGSPTFGWQWACYITGIDDLLSVRRGLVLLDEADAWFSATEWQKVSFQQKLFWTQHRKEGLNIIWTCTHLDRMLNVIRDITETQWRCMKWPFRWSVARAFDPQATSSARKSSRWLATRLREDLGELYDTGMRVRHRSEEKEGLQRGSSDVYGGGYAVREGTAAECWELAQNPAWRGFRPAGDSETVQVVAPLLRVGEVETLARLVQNALLNEEATGSERVAARRLTPVVQRLMGRRWSPMNVRPASAARPVVSIEAVS